MPRRTVVVAASRWQTWSARSSERPAPIMCQPGSRIMLAVTPCSDRIPVSIRPADSATWWLCGCAAQRRGGPVDGAEGAPGVGRELVAHARQDVAQPVEPEGDAAQPAAVEQQRAEVGVEVARRRAGDGPASRCTAPISTARLAPPVERGRVRKSSASACAVSTSRSRSSARSA